MTTTDEVETNEIGINVIHDQMQYKDKIINTEPKPEMIDAAVTTNETFKKDKANNTMLIKKTHVSTSTPKIKTEKSQVNMKKCEQNHAATNTPVKYFSSASQETEEVQSAIDVVTNNNTDDNDFKLIENPKKKNMSKIQSSGDTAFDIFGDAWSALYG